MERILLAVAGTGAALYILHLRRRQRPPTVRVGVSCFLIDPLTGKFVVGIRAGSHGAATWHNPGGHLELGERPEDAACRELAEETGIVVSSDRVVPLGTTSDVFRPDKHYVTLHMLAEWEPSQGQPRRLEPDKCLGWVWKRWSQIEALEPKLFAPMQNLMRSPAFHPPVGSRLLRLRRHARGKVIFCIGYPGSGKGTQGKMLAEQLMLPHVSTGELFRAEARSGSAVGKRMHELMQRGAILPPELTFDYLRREFRRAKYRDGFLLDGYPKDGECFDFIVALLRDELNMAVGGALFFDVPRAEVHRRLTGRLLCARCELNYSANIASCRPLVAGRCDACAGPLAERADDSPATIDARLDSYDRKTMPNVARFQALGALLPIDAAASPSSVNRQILEGLEARLCPPLDSYYLDGTAPNAAEERSTKWHNHLDAESDVLLHEIVRVVQARVPAAQQKVYPISHLRLGPQTECRAFEDVYQRLPNFHPIHEARDEAFTTGKMGDAFDYAMQRATLEAAFSHPRRGVMTEVEEDLYELETSSDGVSTVTRDDGDSTTALDWSQLQGWRERMLPHVPAYELHHAFDVPKLPTEHRPPIDLARLSAEAARDVVGGGDAPGGLQCGGWFVFAKADRWAYRSNEFSDESYDVCKARLVAQAKRVREVAAALLADESRRFKSACSLEKVHAIWRV